MKRTGFSADGPVAMLAGVWVGFDIRASAPADPKSQAFPVAGWFDRAEIEVSGAVIGAVPIIECALTHDPAGAHLASRVRDQPFDVSPGSATDGGTVFSIAGYFPRTSQSVPDQITVWLRFADLTGATVVRGMWTEESP